MYPGEVEVVSAGGGVDPGGGGVDGPESAARGASPGASSKGGGLQELGSELSGRTDCASPTAGISSNRKAWVPDEDMAAISRRLVRSVFMRRPIGRPDVTIPRSRRSQPVRRAVTPPPGQSRGMAAPP